MKDPAKRLAVLQEEWHGCDLCELADIRKGDHIVFGAGPSNADILILSAAPDFEEMSLARPLAGDMGDLLDSVLKKAGIKPNTVFRMTLVGCRPYVLIPESDQEEEKIQDREPNKYEIAACKPRVNEIIYTVDPRLIVALGEVPWKVLVDNKQRGKKYSTITKAQGVFFKTTIQGRVRPVTYPVLATLSLKRLMSNPGKAPHDPIATTTQALREAARYLGWLKRNEKK